MQSLLAPRCSSAFVGVPGLTAMDLEVIVLIAFYVLWFEWKSVQASEPAGLASRPAPK